MCDTTVITPPTVDLAETKRGKKLHKTDTITLVKTFKNNTELFQIVSLSNEVLCNLFGIGMMNKMIMSSNMMLQKIHKGHTQ